MTFVHSMIFSALSKAAIFFQQPSKIKFRIYDTRVFQEHSTKSRISFFKNLKLRFSKTIPITNRKAFSSYFPLNILSFSRKISNCHIWFLYKSYDNDWLEFLLEFQNSLVPTLGQCIIKSFRKINSKCPKMSTNA